MKHYGTGIKHTPIDYKGRRYSGPYWVAQNHGVDPGWFIYGRSMDEYAFGGIISIVARPDLSPRKWPNWTKSVNPGWRTKREALQVCARFNALLGA